MLSKNLTVIAIDDEQHANEHMTRCCSMIDFIDLVATYTNPFDALSELNSGKIDLLFIDLNMRSILAPQFIPHITSNVKVVIVSSELNSVINSFNLNLTGIINKPYSCNKILDVCKKFYLSKT